MMDTSDPFEAQWLARYAQTRSAPPADKDEMKQAILLVG
jgi:hypothetical protein